MDAERTEAVKRMLLEKKSINRIEKETGVYNSFISRLRDQMAAEGLDVTPKRQNTAMSEATRAAAKELFRSGKTYREVMEETGLSKCQVGHVKEQLRVEMEEEKAKKEEMTKEKRAEVIKMLARKISKKKISQKTGLEVDVIKGIKKEISTVQPPEDVKNWKGWFEKEWKKWCNRLRKECGMELLTEVEEK